jgi:ribosomal subunit interface protein
MRIELRGLGFAATAALERHAERRLLFALGRFAERLEDVAVRFEDVNGPRGGVDKRCRVVARLRPAGALRIEEHGEDLYLAIDRAADRIGRAVGRELARRRSLRRGVPPRPTWRALA